MDTTIKQTPQWEDLAISAAPQGTAPVVPVQKPYQPTALPASYLTHELRAPITSIRLGLEILQEQVDGRLDADEKQMLSLAVKNTSRLEGLVNDIMDYSKIMAGKMKAAKELCDPRELLAESFDSMRAMALAQGVKLVKEEGEPLPRINAESRRVIQVLTNLISNAIKFTPARGWVTISCSKGRFEHEGTIVFKVKDTGRGIPAKDIENIFDMFVQSSTTKASEGTGLGLTLARLMVEMHGGRIWAESWKGTGASFYFTIPIASQDLFSKVEVYPKPLEYSGLLVSMARRFNAFLALFV
jgi:signal transduction histidine kinase